jgi:hypothetical protein
MNTFTYTVDFDGRTFTGRVQAQSETRACLQSWRAARKQIMEETGALPYEALHALNSEALTVERNPVLINMLTGEKIVGPAGMNEEMLFEMMAV